MQKSHFFPTPGFPGTINLSFAKCLYSLKLHTEPGGNWTRKLLTFSVVSYHFSSSLNYSPSLNSKAAATESLLVVFLGPELNHRWKEAVEAPVSLPIACC
ncbi:hypothetical protein PVAP13_6NG040183 [Panicum virgatum]|uniref:Uncharacterized protein n=1 Tax=Panicum virgatum TaxID=38727 RepID=A0A8T0QTK8_PANVG|nr:hypothetical protein PVAP13_6NG040183 [Panicum virgatum]